MSTATAPPDTTSSISDEVADGWKSRSDRLADWCMSRMVNRADCHGQYIDITKRKDSQRESNLYTSKNNIKNTILSYHFCGYHTGHLVGLHSTSRDASGNCWCRWVAVDIDRHGDDGDPEVNLRFALAIRAKMEAIGLPSLVIDSNGRGGIHLIVVFEGPIPAPKAHAFAQWLVARWEDAGLVEKPETFPKQPNIKEGKYGNWLRLPGRHHTRDHFSRVWAGDGWLEGAEAADAILDVGLAREGLIPQEAYGAAKPSGGAHGRADSAGAKTKGRGPAPATDAEVAEEALGHLAHMAEQYDDWIHIGMCLAALGPEGLAIWDRWSATAQEKYQAGACAEKWATFTPSGGLSLGTLFHLARGAGWPGRPRHRAQEGREMGGGGPVTEDDGETFPVKEDDDPHRLARVFISGNFAHEDGPTIRFHRGEFHRWNGRSYVMYADAVHDIVADIEQEFNRLNVDSIRKSREKANEQGPVTAGEKT